MGPNAKLAAYHGGGSASLAAYYAVTPFDGISAQLTSPPEFIDGCYAHKELPLLGNFLKTDKGENGITFKAYNEPPSVKDRDVVEEIHLSRTELLMMDYHSPKLDDLLWFADIEGTYSKLNVCSDGCFEDVGLISYLGYYESPEDCDFEFGLGVYGTAKLFVDGKLVIDNDTKQTKGTLFFCCGTIEEKATFPMKKGQKYHLKIEFGSASTCKLDQGSNVLAGGGAVRLGGCKVIDPDEEVLRAVAMAKEADQVIICAGLNVCLMNIQLGTES